MSERLAGKIAIITGAAAGIGRGIVQAFIKQGASVLAVDIDQQRGDELAASNPDRVRFFCCDISKPDNAALIVKAALDNFGSIHVLVNNAHASRQVPLLETTQEHIDLSFGTSFYPTLWLMQAAHPELKRNQGSVINFGSGAGISGQETQASYAAAKEAIRAISRVAANEWGKDNINVNVICPLAATEGVERWLKEFPEMLEPTLNKVPLKRFGDPEQDIGPVAVFLASDDANYMTGQTLMADGGSIKMY